MTHDSPSATNKLQLDDLLMTMGITREQLAGMTADDLFAAATQWQGVATVAGAETESFVFPIDRDLDILQKRPSNLASLN